MHLVDGHRNGRRSIDDGQHLCDAIGAVSDTAAVHVWAERFAVLGDPSRLALLLAIRRAGEICVSDLALATGLKDSTVSQALRLLRAHALVDGNRDGRVIRYHLIDPTISELLDYASTAAATDRPPSR